MPAFRLAAAVAVLTIVSSHVNAQPMGRLRPPPQPPGNAITPSKANLGKSLFWDEQLSSTLTVACATCHMPETGGTDPRSIPGNFLSTNPGPDGRFGTPDDITGSIGVPLTQADGHYLRDVIFRLDEQVGTRKAPVAINAGYSRNLFWDGRALEEFRDPLTNAVILQRGASLESQAASPPLNSTEMAHVGRDWNEIAQRVRPSSPLALAQDIPADLESWINGRPYDALFAEAFGTPEVTPARIIMAIATYERTLFTDQTPFDDFLDGVGQLPPQEEQGRQLFIQFRCNECHAGPLTSDDLFHNTGVRPPGEDLGRFNVTGDPQDRGRFKTPTLRNVELRAPYFHNGEMRTLEDVVDFYNRGGDFSSPNKDPRIRPLNMNSQQRSALLAFLRRPLTDARVASALPPFDHPTLNSDSGRGAEQVGVGRAGSGGFVPRLIAIEPPILGNGRFAVAIDAGRGGAGAIFVMDKVDPLERFGAPRVTLAPTGLITRSVTLDGAGPGDGSGSVVLSIPDQQDLDGVVLFGRWFVLDPEAPDGWSWSPATRVKLFK